MAFFEAERVNFHFGDFHAVREVSFKLEKGRALVVCGPSGSGKSTLIRTINRLAAPLTSGRMSIDGQDLGTLGLGDLYRRVGMVFQRFNLFRHLTVLDNIALPQRRVLRRGRREAAERARSLLDRVGLLDKMDVYPSRLSGGQQQRVAICRALAMDPELLLFDEPTSALDPEMVVEVLQVMQGLAVAGMTMIVVTHEMGFAREISSEVLFMERGEVVERAPPAEFFANPREERTRMFLDQILHHRGTR